MSIDNWMGHTTRGLTAVIGLLVSTSALAHVFEVQKHRTDGETKGSNDYGASYDWRGSTTHFERRLGRLEPPIHERTAYAFQTFRVNTRLFGLDLEILHAWASAAATYYTDTAGYENVQNAWVSVAGTVFVRCSGNGGCSDIGQMPSTELYRGARTLDFGTILGSNTLTSRVIADVSWDISSESNSSKFFGANSLDGRATAKLATSVHAITRQTMSGTATRDYRLIDVSIDGTINGRQTTYAPSAAGVTQGTLTWSQQYYVDFALMDGKISYTKSAPGMSRTIVLVNEPEYAWSGHWVNDDGSTKAF